MSGAISTQIVEENLPKVNVFARIPKQPEPVKSINRGRYHPSTLEHVYRLNLNSPMIRNIPRAGVIFYTFIDGELHMCFGKDRRSNDITDFGGKRKNYENPVECALREAMEESRLVFGRVGYADVEGLLCLYNRHMLIIFIPVGTKGPEDIRELTRENFSNEEFLNLRQKNTQSYNEIAELVWLNEDQIKNLFSPRPEIQMFAKVRRFIFSSKIFSEEHFPEIKEAFFRVIAD